MKIAPKIALGSDMKTHLTGFVVDHLSKMGIECDLYGPPAGEPDEWAEVGAKVAENVASGKYDQGILFCWTGTGVSIAANKVPGIRAALCVDAQTASGARKWNDANVLVFSLRHTSEGVAKEILEAWFGAEADESEAHNVAKISELDEKYRSK